MTAEPADLAPPDGDDGFSPPEDAVVALAQAVLLMFVEAFRRSWEQAPDGQRVESCVTINTFRLKSDPPEFYRPLVRYIHPYAPGGQANTAHLKAGLWPREEHAAAVARAAVDLASQAARVLGLLTDSSG